VLLHICCTATAQINVPKAACAVVIIQIGSIIGNWISAQGGGGAWLLKFLGVIILSFGFRLFERRRLVARHAAAILGGVAFAVASSLLATALAARLLRLPPGGLPMLPLNMQYARCCCCRRRFKTPRLLCNRTLQLVATTIHVLKAAAQTPASVLWSKVPM
jgi:LrgB-like family